MFHIVRDKVTRQRAEADLNRGPSAYQPNTLPLGQTSSRHNRSDVHLLEDNYGEEKESVDFLH